MAALKYKDSQGNYQPLVGLNVQNEVVQTTGQSTTAVMSQKAVSDLIPAQASPSNQLADKDFVNSSVTTATATYQGSYNLVSDLGLTIQASHGQIEQALNTEATGADNNDYSFVQIPTSDSTPTEIASVERYKYNGTTWSYEYAINNSGFTAAQWAAVNSNITSGLVAQLNAMSGTTQSSISKLFGMDASGNFQNISTSNLASVLGVGKLKFEDVGTEQSFDFDNFTSYKQLSWDSSKTYTNAPVASMIDGSVFLSFGLPNSSAIFIIGMSRNSNILYFRYRCYTWSKWFTLS